MKKTLATLLLSGALVLTGCGDSNTDYTQVSGQQGNPGPIVTPTPQPTAGYFVDAANGNDTTAAAAANPTSDTPFATIAAAVADAPTNTTITVRAGTYTGAVTLKDGQRLLGTAGGNRPVLSNTLTLANGNTVDFLEFRNITGRAIDVNGRNGGTITNNVIVDGSAAGVRAENVSGTWNVTGNSITNVGGIAITFRIVGSDAATAYVNDNTIISTNGAIGFLTEANAQVLAQVHGNTMTGSGMEIIVGDSSDFGLDLEDNTNDGTYLLRVSDVGPASLEVEQLSVLDTAKPAGAGNTGTFTISSGPGFVAPTEVANGSLGL